MTFRPLIRRIAMGLSITAISSAVVAGASREQAILAAEDAYTRAAVARDQPALARLLCPELIYLHAGGEITPLNAYLKIALDPASRLRGIRLSERRVLATRDMASVTGKVVYDMGVDRHAVYSATYMRKKGKWCVANWQNTADRSMAK